MNLCPLWMAVYIFFDITVLYNIAKNLKKLQQNEGINLRQLDL